MLRIGSISFGLSAAIFPLFALLVQIGVALTLIGLPKIAYDWHRLRGQCSLSN